MGVIRDSFFAPRRRSSHHNLSQLTSFLPCVRNAAFNPLIFSLRLAGTDTRAARNKFDFSA